MDLGMLCCRLLNHIICVYIHANVGLLMIQSCIFHVLGFLGALWTFGDDFLRMWFLTILETFSKYPSSTFFLSVGILTKAERAASL